MQPGFYKYLLQFGKMPRNLFSSDRKDESIVQSPEAQTPRSDHQEHATATDQDGYNEFTIHRDESREQAVHQPGRIQAINNGKDKLHPYVQTLSISNLDSCVALENAIFPEHERCSREKVPYYSFRFIYNGNCEDVSQPLPVSLSFLVS